MSVSRIMCVCVCVCVYVCGCVCVCVHVCVCVCQTQAGDDALDGVIFFCKSFKVRVRRDWTNALSY